jgi:hypothetical protein
MTSEFTAITTVGGLLPVDLLVRVAAGDGDLPAIKASDYGLAATERTREAISRSWNRLSGLWQAYEDRLAALPVDDPATTPTRELWILPLLDELRFTGVTLSTGLEIEGRSYPISHMAGAVPIHILGAGTRLDVRTPGRAGAAQLSPHALVQQYLNRSDEHLWGIVTNGRQLRLLRDSTSLTKQAYVEFDLEAMFSEGLFADFTTLWMTLHGTRLTGDRPEDCVLEQWLSVSHERGVRALEHLRDGVKAAIERLGAGFISHPGNGDLRERLRSGELDAQDYYRQLLRVVYRMLFLLVAEERGLLHPPNTPAPVRQRYDQHYSISRLRRLAERRRGTAHSDRWEGIKVVTAVLGGLEGQPALGLPALGSLLWTGDSTADLSSARLRNADLLSAMRSLSLVEEPESRRNRRIDYRNMGTEELGSVYESLLELEPVIHLGAGRFELAETGDERSETGAHYTPPPILAKVLDFALDPQIAERVRQPDPEAALLDLRVLDPAVGSGHFLIAAGHRIARALAQVRTGEQEPAPEIQRQAYRDVVTRCLYGVDVNPMAVELAKVALWLEALDPGKPLSFLDHHIRCGDSLLGVPLGAAVTRDRATLETRRRELMGRVSELEALLSGADPQRIGEIRRQISEVERAASSCRYESWPGSLPDEAFRKLDTDVAAIATSAKRSNARERKGGEAQLGFGAVDTNLPRDLIETFNELGREAEDDLEQVGERAARYRDAVTRSEYLAAADLADLWMSAWFWPKDQPDPRTPTHGLLLAFRDGSGTPSKEQFGLVRSLAERYRFFSYELAFPEVFEPRRGGFDLVIGNPPYLGGHKISGAYGHRYLNFLKSNFPAVTVRGKTDLVAFFLRRCMDAVNPRGDLAFITTDKVAQGDTKAAGLDVVLAQGAEIENAIRSEPWAGDGANVFVSLIHLTWREVTRGRTLDGEVVEYIASSLRTSKDREALELTSNLGIVAPGTEVGGAGFWVDGRERQRLIDEDLAALEVIKPFLGGRQITQQANPWNPVRWVIDFGQMTLEEAQRYPGPLKVVETLVKPHRETLNDKRFLERWWQHAAPARVVYERIATHELSTVIVIAQISKHAFPLQVPSDFVYQNKVQVVVSSRPDLYGLLASNIHWLWVARSCTTQGTGIVYNHVRLFQTFPLPDPDDGVVLAGDSVSAIIASSCGAGGISLTDLLNLLADPEASSPSIAELRAAIVSLDEAVARVYGWDDLIERFDHGHYPTERFGVRWTVKPETQREIEQRLLELNLERAAAEDTK